MVRWVALERCSRAPFGRTHLGPVSPKRGATRAPCVDTSRCSSEAQPADADMALSMLIVVLVGVSATALVRWGTPPLFIPMTKCENDGSRTIGGREFTKALGSRRERYGSWAIEQSAANLSQRASGGLPICRSYTASQPSYISPRLNTTGVDTNRNALDPDATPCRDQR
jgi:hypothetical protein